MGRPQAGLKLEEHRRRGRPWLAGRSEAARGGGHAAHARTHLKAMMAWLLFQASTQWVSLSGSEIFSQCSMPNSCRGRAEGGRAWARRFQHARMCSQAARTQGALAGTAACPALHSAAANQCGACLHCVRQADSAAGHLPGILLIRHAAPVQQAQRCGQAAASNGLAGSVWAPSERARRRPSPTCKPAAARAGQRTRARARTELHTEEGLPLQLLQGARHALHVGQPADAGSQLARQKLEHFHQLGLQREARVDC